MKNSIALFLAFALFTAVHAQQNSNSNVPVKQDDGSASTTLSAISQPGATLPIKKTENSTAKIAAPSSQQTLVPIKNSGDAKSSTVASSTTSSLPPIKKADSPASTATDQSQSMQNPADKSAAASKVILPSSIQAKKDSTIAQ